VSTQVVEAGVDISAHHLWTELAPWPSMLQRMGRLNRRGDDQDARAFVWETPSQGSTNKAERIGPYENSDIKLAKKLADKFAPLSQEKPFAAAIDDLINSHQRDVSNALQPRTSPLPRALDVHGLFSTERDVHGGFTDVSAFVRGTDPDVDVTVFWRDWSGPKPPEADELDGPLLEPGKEGCPVSFFRLQKVLESSKNAAWVWNDEDDRWDRVNHWDVRPGMLIMLKRDVGGYDATEGWTGEKSNILLEAPRAGRGATLRGDARTEVGYWSTLEVHLRDARAEAVKLCDALTLNGEIRVSVVEAAGLHDLGKAHPQWQKALPDRSVLADALLAKTPRVLAVDMEGPGGSAVVSEVAILRPTALRLPDQPRRRERRQVTRLRWAIEEKLDQDGLTRLLAFPEVCWAGHAGFKPGLRHEVASALAMWRKYRDSDEKPFPALAVYLAATHHGKVRTALRSTTAEGDDAFGVRSEPASLFLCGEDWPLDLSVAKDGADGHWEGSEFVLTGHGWTGLVADLLGPWRPEEPGEAGVVPASEPRHLGPFALAYLEALVRIADWRASDKPSASVKPSEVVSRG
jgi:CRISPR-associated endonuclease/helicase Cas3